MDLEIGDKVIVQARNRHSDGSHGIVDGFNHTPGAMVRIKVAFSRGRSLTFQRHELIKE